jgi:hypothetical protein
MNRTGRGPTPALAQSNNNAKKPNSAEIFFSTTNYARILQPLREQYEHKINVPELPDDLDRRLQKALSHYMNEVFRVNGSQLPINSLNQEAYRETSLNIDGWLNKQVSTPVQKTQQYMIPQKDPLFENVGSRFEREQQTRSVTQIPQSSPVDFSIPKNDDDEEDPIEKYERLRKQREVEARLNNTTSANSKNKNTIIDSTSFSEPSATSPTSILPPISNQPAPPPLLAPRPQDYIIKQEDVVKYKENEFNLYVYSGDRDWLNNRNENRYNFTLNFNTLNDNGTTFSPAVKERFKNITRMELVKTILSAESLDISVLPNSNAVGTNTNRVLNILSYPYLMIRISEWTGNGYGTNQYIDDTFGLVQYDQTWKSDPKADNFGYISLTPRYLKAQRIYHPTPLATLQKLSIQVERPDGKPLTKDLDTLDISKIYLSKSISTAVGSSVFASVPDVESYIFIKTTTYFSKFFVTEGDRIIFRGYNIDTDSYVTQATADDFNNFINRTDGHIVCGIGYSSDNSIPITVTDGSNSVGYANYIIIRSRFQDPTTGATGRNYFGGGADSTNEDLIKTRLDNNTPAGPCALLNANRQSHFVLRLITREMDSLSNLRPDNS